MSVSVFEAEQMQRWGGFAAVDGDAASGGKLVKLACGWKGGLRDTYEGPAGKADLTIHAQDELDGASYIDVYVDHVKVGTVKLDGTGSTEWGSDDGDFSAFTLEGIDLAPGQTLDLVACRDGGEWVRIDKVVVTSHAAAAPAPKPCDGKDTTVLIDETWDDAKDADDTDGVKKDAGWDVKDGALFTSGCDDGTLKFTPVSLDGHTEAALTLKIKANDVSRFETGGKFGDTFKIVLVIDGTAVVLDEFVRDGHVFKGSITGQTFGESFTELSYAAIDLPAGADKATLKFISDFTSGNEIMRIDDVQLTATKDACAECDATAKVLSFDDLPKGTIVESQFDGVTITAIAAGARGDDVVIEAEDFTHRDGVWEKWNWKASDHAHVKAGHEGAIETAFTGQDDLYKIAIDIQDEKDGAGTVEVFVNGVSVGSFKVEGKEAESGWTNGSDHGRFSTFTLPDAVEIAHGDTIRVAYSDGNGEMGRIDKVTFVDQTTGNRAMVFDTDHPTGGDHDLTNGEGGVLIISEDGDSSDPDDNVSGGAIRFDFDTPASIQTLDIVDTEEGGTIKGFDADGTLIGEVAIPRIGDNEVQTVDIALEGVATLVVELNGSGAIDNLCYDHGPDGGTPPKVCTDFETFADGTATEAGDSGALVFDGVTFSADRANDGDTLFDDAMIFDTANPTGGDSDLASDNLGNVIIVSEDGDSGDPDDNAGGGTIRAVFDEVSILDEVTVLDIEGLGTTIDLFDATGALIRSFDVPPTGDGGQSVVDLENTAGVKTLLLNLATSGAIGEVCFSPDPDVQPPLPASLGDVVFLDTNADGIQDAGETGIAGVTVTLTGGGTDGVIGTADDTIATTTTDADGAYLFDALNAGEEYQVSFDTPAGFVPSPTDEGTDDSLDSDGITTPVVVLAEGEFNDTLDQGFYELAGLGDFVFFDADGNGVQDTGEAGVAGVTVTLRDASGGAISTTTTDTNGAYSFTGLVPGTYSVAFAAPAIFAFTAANAGVDDAIDSDANETTGETGTVTLVSGEFNDTLDAGLVDAGTARLGDRVFFDENGNGLQDAGEAGAANVGVTLRDGSGTVVATTTTDGNGNYLFDNLLAGTYAVTFDAVSGFGFTAQDAGDDARDSDADAAGLTAPVTLAIGEENLTIDAGLVDLNDVPTPQDDVGKVCADELLTVDVLANDTDPDLDPLTIVSVGGFDISSGPVSLSGVATVTDRDGNVTSEAFDGLTVTLTNGDLTIDGSVAFADLEIGEIAEVSFVYGVDDPDGLGATANLDLTFCGALNTLGSISDNLPETAVFGIGGFFVADAYTALVLDTGDAVFDNQLFDKAFCVERDEDIVFNQVDIPASLYLGVADEIPAGALSQNTIDNLDLINWIINQDFTSISNGETSGDGAGRNYTETEIQSAIWGLTDNDTMVENPGNVGGLWNGSRANAQEILQLALANGEGFTPGAGDLVTVVIDPVADYGVPEGADHDQAFLIALPFSALEQDCIC